jgi:PmbA protein
VSDLLNAAKDAVALAMKKGAQEASANAYKSRDVEIGWRDGKVEKVSEATTRGLSISLYVDQRYSVVSTSDLRPEALEKFVEESVAMARTLAKDENRRLPDPKLYEGRAKLDLQLSDPKYGDVTADERRKIAAQIEDAARGVKGKGEILSVETSFSDSRSQSAKVMSNGFEGENETTSYWMGASTTVKDPDGRRPEGSMFAGSRFFAEMPGPAAIGRVASERAFASVGAQKIPSAVVPIVVENRVSGRLVRALTGPLSGGSLQQKQSFLEGQIGKPIASKLLSITDDPHLVKGFGSRLYDSEGIASKKMPIIEAGVLKNYYINVYYGRKLGVAPTTGGSSNLVFALGKKDLEELIKDIKEGILITGFLGGNSNGTTGDYSLGIQGFRIEKGARTTPLAEMNISGNQKELWKKLIAVGNDPYPYSSTLTPTMVLDGVSVAGA